MNLPDALLAAVQKRADQEGRTGTSIVEQALRDLLAEDQARRTVEPQPTYGIPGSVLLVDINDRDALHDLLDAAGR